MWILIALFEAFANALATFLRKQQVKTVHPVTALFAGMCAVLGFMLIIVAAQGIPRVTGQFFLYITPAAVLDIIAFTALSWAVKHSEVSLLSPLSAVTPIFATLFGALFLRELPTIAGLIGIVIIGCGVYLLNLADAKEGVFKPFEKLLAERGVKLYFITMIIWGITPVLQKQAIHQTYPTRPLFASFVDFALVTLCLGVIAGKQIVRERVKIKANKWSFISFGLIYALAQLAGYTALNLTQVGYATAIFSTTSLFAIALGGLFFKEKRLKERLLGATVMIIGATLIAL